MRKIYIYIMKSVIIKIIFGNSARFIFLAIERIQLSHNQKHCTWLGIVSSSAALSHTHTHADKILSIKTPCECVTKRQIVLLATTEKRHCTHIATRLSQSCPYTITTHSIRGRSPRTHYHQKYLSIVLWPVFLLLSYQRTRISESTSCTHTLTSEQTRKCASE